MPSFQSIALIAAASTASANYLGGDYEYTSSDLAARDVYDGDLVYERDLYEDIDSLMQHYQRDVDDNEYIEGQFAIREAKGAGKAVSSALRGAGKGATAFGNIGTGLTGISDVVNSFRGNGGKRRRDLEGYYEDSELFAREAAKTAAGGGRRTAASIGHGLSAVGHGASSGAEAFGHVGDGLTGISNIVNLFKGGKGKRDLDDLYEGITLYTREPKGKGFLSSLTHGHGNPSSSSPSSSSGSSSGHPKGFASLLHGANAAGHGAGHAANAFGRFGDGVNGLANAASLFGIGGSSGQGSANSKRDLEDLFDDAELFVREASRETPSEGSRSFNSITVNGQELLPSVSSLIDAIRAASQKGVKSKRDLEDLLDAADAIVAREELALEDDY